MGVSVLERTFLTVAEVSAQLRVNPDTIYRAIAAGELGAVRVGRQLRIDEVGLARYLARTGRSRP